MNERQGPAVVSPADMPAEWIQWIPVGPVSLDRNGDLAFPPVPPVPGIYRFTVKDGRRVVAEYIGVAKASLLTRFRLYRSRGRNPALPLDRKTTSRNARYLLDALKAGQSVRVALVADVAISPDGQAVPIDLADNVVRRVLERKLITALCAPGVDVLNRHGNPSWKRGA